MNARRIAIGTTALALLIAMGGSAAGARPPVRSTAVSDQLVSATAVRVAGGTPEKCAPVWKSVAPPGWLVPNIDTRGVDVLSASDVRIGISDRRVPSVLDWNGISVAAMPAVPQGLFNGGADERFGVSTHSFDSPDDGWLHGPGFSAGFSTPRDSDYALRWHGGRWTVVSLPVSPAPATVALQALDVASISPDSAWAVGGAFQVGIGVVRSSTVGALVEHWDGTAWRVVANPASSQAGASLEDLAVVSAADIWAVGRAGTASAVTPLVEHWDGASWHLIPIPAGTGSSQLTDVSADAAGDIWAAGEQTQPGTSTGGPLVEHWDGTAWRAVPGLPDVGVAWGFGSGIGIGDIYAASPPDVWATGPDPAVGRTGLFLHYDGAAWTAVPLPDPPEYGQRYYYTAIAGTGSDDIWAAGIAYYNTTATAVVAHLSCGRK